MSSEREVFALSGPVHLTSVNWDCPDHQRSVAASLVKGAYVLELDRQLGRQGTPEALAPPWWESFHFQVIKELVDDADSSIFGAAYELKPPPGFPESSVTKAPTIVIAFRGTLKMKGSRSRDIKLDRNIVENDLHRTSRFEIAMQAVRSYAEAFGHQNLWIAGHSLGASLATLAGKGMAMQGVNLEAFLFNPPYVSAIEWIKDEEVKQLILIAKSFVAAVFASAVGDPWQTSNSFAMLSAWVPRLFVNKADCICSAYIGYFEQRKKMKEIGAGKVGKLATENSLKDLLLSTIREKSDSASLHLLPSANLTVNSSPAHAHGIQQWWSSDLALQSKEYLYNYVISHPRVLEI